MTEFLKISLNVTFDISNIYNHNEGWGHLNYFSVITIDTSHLELPEIKWNTLENPVHLFAKNTLNCVIICISMWHKDWFSKIRSHMIFHGKWCQYIVALKWQNFCGKKLIIGKRMPYTLNLKSLWLDRNRRNSQGVLAKYWSTSIIKLQKKNRLKPTGIQNRDIHSNTWKPQPLIHCYHGCLKYLIFVI